MPHSQTHSMTGNRIFVNMLVFAFPIIVSSFFQRMFNVADTMIVGRFSGDMALAAVGSNSPLVGLFVWGLMGLSVGVDVTVSKMIGSRNLTQIHRAVHTAITIAIGAGGFTSITGICCSRMLLEFMKVPDNILPWACLYIRIYFVGIFFNVIYQFTAAILRSSGDTKRPMAYLMASGLLNVILNLFFVCLLHMDVAGVAIATAFSQFTACTLAVTALMREEGYIRLNLKELCFDPSIAWQIISIGIPSLVQNVLFSVSNMVIQTSINAFGATTIAANSIGMTIEDFVYVGTSAVNQACTTFTGQNNGANNMKNIRKVMIYSTLLTILFGFSIGYLSFRSGSFLLGLFTKDPLVIADGLIRLQIVAVFLFMNGVSDVFAASLRGMGYSFIPMVSILTCICGVRLIYVFKVFPLYGTLKSLYICYPLSWIISSAVLLAFWFILYRRFCRKRQNEIS